MYRVPKLGAAAVTTQTLNEREQLILQAVVHLYITSAEPVGSRATRALRRLDEVLDDLDRALAARAAV